MGKEDAYKDWLRQDFSEIIETLNLDERQKHILKSRWLDQVTWMEGKTSHTRNRYYLLRMTSIIGGVTVPALIGINNMEGTAGEVIRWVVFGISLIVAISSATEEFFRYGERWRHYRGTVELLKSEGWQFFQLSGAYKRQSEHTQAYEKFAGRVEEILQSDVQKYIAEIVADQESKDEG